MAQTSATQIFDNKDGKAESSIDVAQAEEILKREFPLICNDVSIMVCRPFRLIWDPSQETASTDCVAEVRINPWFFLKGDRETGFGIAYHESGHIRFSPYGGDLMKLARRRGGELLGHILNIVMDRKDDLLVADHAPGFADRLRRRLLVIRTLGARERHANFIKRMSADEAQSFLRHLRPADVYEDFFYAAKCHIAPRFKPVRRAMKHLTRKKLLLASPDQLLAIAEKVIQILGIPPKLDDQKAFLQLCLKFASCEHGTCGLEPLPPELQKALASIIRQNVDKARNNGMIELMRQLRSMGMVHPGPISTGRRNRVPLKKLESKPDDAEEYQKILRHVESYKDELIKKLRLLDNPSEYTLYGQDEGDLDFSECARIAAGLPGYHEETVEERNISVDMHLAIDTSGSMAGSKLAQAKRIAALFAASLLELKDMYDINGHIWSYDDRAVFDVGSLQEANRIAGIDHGSTNSDTHMLEYVGQKLAKSQHRRKVLLVLCDDGPDDMALAGKLSAQMLARGIIVIHLLVGVHGTPQIFPIELLYTSMEECLAQLGTLLETILTNLG